jgi:ribosomal protein S21
MSENDKEVLEAINSNEEIDLEIEQSNGIEDVEALKKQIEEKDTFARQAVARAKKAEADLKALKEKAGEATQITNNTPSEETIDIKILQSQGLDDDAIAYLKKISQVNGTTLIEAKKDELYKAFEEKREREEKAKKASLGASRGSGAIRKEKSITSAGLSDEEHKELWKKSLGR